MRKNTDEHPSLIPASVRDCIDKRKREQERKNKLMHAWTYIGAMSSMLALGAGWLMQNADMIHPRPDAPGYIALFGLWCLAYPLLKNGGKN